MEEGGGEWIGEAGGERTGEEGGEWMGEGVGEWMGEGVGEWSVSLGLIEKGYPWQLAWLWVVEVTFPQGASHLQYFNA